ncbi:MAG: outer membrane beta-barrel protein [Bacteroidia bacterium]|nr:outer membrane beta-barrel protein [Bacteroidia bacterium]
MSKSSTFLLLLSFFLLVFIPAKAQYEEIGIQGGISHYKGELSENLFKPGEIHPFFGAFFRHNWNRHWSWKLEFNFGKISGNDVHASGDFELDRNLSFQSTIIEFSPQIEFNFFPYETGNPQYPFTPYLFTGISVFRFNPKAEWNDVVYELQPLGTEGQGSNGTSKYKRVQIAIPIGGGLKFSVGQNLGIGVEIGARRTYTDYLDDVSTVYPNQQVLLATNGAAAVALSDRSFSGTDTTSSIPDVYLKQRGNSKDKDWYLFAGVTLYFRLSSMLAESCKPFKNRRY